jgi:hypothetical protein
VAPLGDADRPGGAGVRAGAADHGQRVRAATADAAGDHELTVAQGERRAAERGPLARLGERGFRLAGSAACAVADGPADREHVARGLAAPRRVVDEPGAHVALELHELERRGSGLGAGGADQGRAGDGRGDGGEDEIWLHDPECWACRMPAHRPPRTDRVRRRADPGSPARGTRTRPGGAKVGSWREEPTSGSRCSARRGPRRSWPTTAPPWRSRRCSASRCSRPAAIPSPRRWRWRS